LLLPFLPLPQIIEQLPTFYLIFGKFQPIYL
jgi:hypothetical protein